ncbi:immunity 49 family protein [Actinomadura alba]|uniref:Immunity 49 family protein n=1 Tax=Actinomadura alba TaxID=406431 RepID=A0ABR7LNQ5_9ACTN|nr:immunity 49 family protein [Actinomadura alba]MBC6466490.1 immunity 49 family protein [Actinomadura alba]
MSDAELATALAVPEELQQLKTLELPEHIQLISDKLLDYVAARFLTDDPRFESRDVWDALRSAADTAADHSFALHTPAGEVARTWIDYVGLGLGIEVQAGERPLSAAWIQAFHLALIVRNERTLLKLYKAVHLLPEGSEAAYARALAARWASTHGLAAQGTVSVEATDGRTALLRSLVQNDHSDFNERLGAALERYRLLAGTCVRDRIAWGPLALAALAHDSGVTIEVESGYLPARLVTGNGPKEAEPGARIPRPPFTMDNVNAYIRSRDKAARKDIKRLFEWGGDWLDFARDRFQVAALRSLADPAAADPRQWTDLVMAGQAACAAFELTVPRGTQVEITLAGRTGTLAADGPTSATTPLAYTRAAALALATRSDDALHALSRVSDEVLQENPYPHVTARFARALRTHLSGDDPRPHVDAGLAMIGDGAHWDCLFRPPLLLFDRLLANDPNGFNRTLAEALDRYRQYFSVGDRNGDMDGLIAIEALGLSCAAHDRGWTIEVESDYLPSRIVDGSWTRTPSDFARFG